MFIFLLIHQLILQLVSNTHIHFRFFDHYSDYTPSLYQCRCLQHAQVRLFHNIGEDQWAYILVNCCRISKLRMIEICLDLTWD